MFYDKNEWEVTEEIRLRYLNDGKYSIDNLHKDLTPITQMVSEYVFHWPAYKTAENHRKHSPTFVYYYEHMGTASAYPPLTIYRVPEDNENSM